MADKSPNQHNAKKVGKSLKEKRNEKHAKKEWLRSRVRRGSYPDIWSENALKVLEGHFVGSSVQWADRVSHLGINRKFRMVVPRRSRRRNPMF